MCLRVLRLPGKAISTIEEVRAAKKRVQGALDALKKAPAEAQATSQMNWRKRPFAQFGHLIHAAFHGPLLFSLVPALCFVPLSLLPCVFFLALCKY